MLFGLDRQRSERDMGLLGQTRRIFRVVAQVVLIVSLSYFVVQIWVRGWRESDPTRIDPHAVESPATD